MTLRGKIVLCVLCVSAASLTLGGFLLGRWSKKPSSTETVVTNPAPVFTMTGPLVELKPGQIQARTQKVVEWKTVVATAPGSTCKEYLKTVTPSCPDCKQTVESPVKRITFNALDAFVGAGAIARGASPRQPGRTQVSLGYGVEVSYRPVCLNGKSISGCLDIRAGADADAQGVVRDARALAGVGISWR